MKRLHFGQVLPGPGGFQKYATEALRQIEQASIEDVEQIIAEFTIDGAFTETRTLTPSTATLGDLVNFVATMVSDIQKRGQKRSYAS